MAIKHNVVKVGGYIDDPNSDDAYTAFSSINEAFKTVIPAAGLPVNEGGTGATTVAQARINLGLSNDRLNTASASQTGIVAPSTAAGIYIRDNGVPFLYSGDAPTAPRWSVTDGGTGGRTVAEAKANLGLNKFSQNPGLNTVVIAPSVDASIIISDTFWGAYKGNAPGFSRALKITDGGTGAETAEQAKINFCLDCFVQQGATNTFMTSPNKDLMINLQNTGISMWRNSTNTATTFRTSLNTMVDGNGFIKASSPIVKLYADNIELNDEAQQQNIEFEKLDIGDYLIKNSSGFAQEGWYVEQPKDSNGNIFHAVEYGTHDNGDIWIKTYEQVMDGTRIVADPSKPIDIKEERFISIRLNEPPQDTSAPLNPTIVDSEGNPAPSRLHELVEGVWVISDENAATLEQERLAAMPALKRRQFRLTLAMNGYDLKEIEALIDLIEDPMQRTIAQIEWQDATDFERTNPTLLMMASKLGLDTQRIDELWSFGLSL